VMERVTEVIDALIAHRLGRHARVAEELQRAGAGGGGGGATVDDLLGSVYGDVSEAQLPVARFSLWAHLRYLALEGRAEALGVAEGEDTLETRWRALTR
jgi:hypothetical protein